MTTMVGLVTIIGMIVAVVILFSGYRGRAPERPRVEGGSRIRKPGLLAFATLGLMGVDKSGWDDAGSPSDGGSGGGDGGGGGA